MLNNNRMVFLAGPIDRVEELESRRWRGNISSIFKRYGYATFSPAHAFYNIENSVHGLAVDRINREAIRSCDNVFVNFNGPTLGSFREVEFSVNLGHKRVFLYTHNDKEREALRTSFSVGGCVLLRERMIGDAVAEMVRHLRVEEEAAAHPGRGPESEEDEQSV